MGDTLEPRAEKYETGLREGYNQASREIANMLQRRGHEAAALVANGEHRKPPTPTLDELASR